MSEFSEAGSTGWTELLERRREFLRRVAGAKMSPRLQARCSASDAAQEVILDAYRKRADYDPVRGLTGWLLGFLDLHIREVIRYHNAQRRAMGREAAVPGVAGVGGAGTDDGLARLAASITSPSGRVIREERARILRDNLARLKERDRQILTMRIDDGLSYSEIASRLGINVSTATSAYSRALQRLKGLLEDFTDGEA